MVTNVSLDELTIPFKNSDATVFYSLLLSTLRVHGEWSRGGERRERVLYMLSTSQLTYVTFTRAKSINVDSALSQPQQWQPRSMLCVCKQRRPAFGGNFFSATLICIRCSTEHRVQRISNARVSSCTTCYTLMMMLSNKINRLTPQPDSVP